MAATSSATDGTTSYCSHGVVRRNSRLAVESRCGAVAWFGLIGAPLCAVARIHRTDPSLRFHIPLIEPDMQISRIRLSDKTSCLCTRKVTRSSPDLQHGDRVSPVYTDRAFYAQPPMPPPGWSFASRRCSGFFLHFNMRRVPQLPHINGVS